MRKLLTILLIMTMSASILVGCGGSDKDNNKESNKGSESHTTQGADENQDVEDEKEEQVITGIKEVLLKDANTGEEIYSFTLSEEEYTWNQLSYKKGLTQIECIDENGEVVLKLDIHLNKYNELSVFHEEQLSAEDAYGKGWSRYAFDDDILYPGVQSRHFRMTKRAGDCLLAVQLPNNDLITGVIYSTGEVEGDIFDLGNLFKNGILNRNTGAIYNCKTGQME